VVGMAIGAQRQSRGDVRQGFFWMQEPTVIHCHIPNNLIRLAQMKLLLALKGDALVVAMLPVIRVASFVSAPLRFLKR